MPAAYNALCLFKTDATAKYFPATDAKLSPDAGTQRCRSKNVLRLAKSRGLLFSGGLVRMNFPFCIFSPDHLSGSFRGVE
jgi:hypothetical protein